jgi:type VI secretion system FHA domain protein
MLLIGKYTIAVQVDSDRVSAKPMAGRSGSGGLGDLFSKSPSPGANASGGGYDSGYERAPPQSGQLPPIGFGPAPLDSAGAADDIPDDIVDQLMGRGRRTPPIVEPQAPPAPVPRHVEPRTGPPAEAGELLELIGLAAAGIGSATVDRAALASIGEVLRVVVEGLRDVLQARKDIKREFRAAMTELEQSENNPLKFSVDADDALRKLFTNQNAGFKPPVEAFREAFDDLKLHQFAMLAGMKAAFNRLLSQFDPEHLEEGFDRGLKRGAILEVMNKTKYWDLYKDMYAALGDDDRRFKRLFGDDFTHAYEEQMRRLTAARRTR